MTIRMTPELRKETTGGRTPAVPGKAKTFTMCSETGKIMLDERDRGRSHADRWMGMSGDHFQIDDEAVPFGFRDATVRTVAFTAYPGAIVVLGSDGKKLLAPIKPPADTISVERDGAGARVHLSAVGAAPEVLYQRGAGEDQTESVVSLSIDIKSKSVGYGFADIPGVATTCVTLTGNLKGVVSGAIGTAQCVASQPNGAGAAFLNQTFVTAGAKTSVEASLDLGVYYSVSDVGWISDILGWDTCLEISGGATGHVGVGGGVEIGVCATPEVTTTFFGGFVGTGAGLGFGTATGVNSSYTSQLLCFQPDLDRLLDGKPGLCKAKSSGPPKKPQKRPAAPGAGSSSTTSVPTTTTSTEPPSGSRSIRDFDFRNRSYDFDCGDNRGPLQVVDGHWTAPGGPWQGVIDSLSVAFGDVTRDGDEDAVVTIGCSIGAGNVGGVTLVMASTPGGLVQVGQTLTGFGAPGGRGVITEEPSYEPEDPMCCPSKVERTTWVLKGTSWARGAVVFVPSG